MGINLQDGIQLFQDETVISGVVTDGCGSTPHPEVGAKLFAYQLARWARKYNGTIPEAGVHELNATLLLEIGAFAGTNLTRFRQFINDYMLFTVVGVISTPERTVIYGAGDGIWAVNGKVTEIDQDNQPDYPAYAVLNPENQEKCELKIYWSGATDEIDSLLVATDGFRYVPEHTMKSFWTDPKYLKNPYSLQRTVNPLVWGGHAKDDISGILLRRKEAAEADSEVELKEAA